MERRRFALTSEQLELLLAFEHSNGLGHLAGLMARDPSVVSRNLQRIAEDHPVLKKVKGRWELTPLGVQVNSRTRAYLEDQEKLLSEATAQQAPKPSAGSKDAVLIVINAQKGLLDAVQESRNNLDAEKNIAALLEHWRQEGRRIVHVKHVSEDPKSSFFVQAAGCDFLDSLHPRENETIVEKTKSSAFTGTNLEALLSKEPGSRIVLTGFTASECIDATARDAAALGFEASVVDDGTATFDLRDPSGKLVKADRIHRLTLLTINAFYAKVVSTRDLLG